MGKLSKGKCAECGLLLALQKCGQRKGCFKMEYRVTFPLGMKLRAGIELESELVGNLDNGIQFVAVQSAVNAAGTTRLRLEHPKAGWISLKEGSVQQVYLDGAQPREALMAKDLNTLKQMCKASNLPVKGSKATLASLLLDPASNQKGKRKAAEGNPIAERGAKKPTVASRPLRVAPEKDASMEKAVAHLEVVRSSSLKGLFFYEHEQAPSGKITSLPHEVNVGNVRLWTTGCRDSLTEGLSSRDRFAGAKTNTCCFAGVITKGTGQTNKLKANAEAAQGHKCSFPGCNAKLYKTHEEVEMLECFDDDSVLKAISSNFSNVLENRHMLDAEHLAGESELSPFTTTLDVRVCSGGHVVGAAAVELVMIGHLGWGIQH